MNNYDNYSTQKHRILMILKQLEWIWILAKSISMLIKKDHLNKDILNSLEQLLSCALQYAKTEKWQIYLQKSLEQLKNIQQKEIWEKASDISDADDMIQNLTKQ